MAEIRYEPFSPAKHQRDAFCCGRPPLDDFLRSLVSQYEKRKLGKTFVAVRPGENLVLGYYTLASGSLSFAHLPAKISKKMPKHPIPVILLARLAVDQTMQGKGLGRGLLMDALHRALKFRRALAFTPSRWTHSTKTPSRFMKSTVLLLCPIRNCTSSCQ